MAQLKYDAILLDDDVWIRDHWENVFSESGKRLAVYPTPNAFLKHLEQHSNETPVFIDFRFKNLHRNGSEIAALALKRGFTKLYITTHMSEKDIEIPGFISEVIDKEPPVWLLRKRAPLDLSKKKELLSSMTSVQLKTFKQRMAELYEAKFGGQDVFCSYFQSHLEDRFNEWEEAIYNSWPDESILAIQSGQRL